MDDYTKGKIELIEKIIDKASENIKDYPQWLRQLLNEEMRIKE